MECKKCKSTALITVRKKDHYCNECFTTNINHKFRSCLGKNRVHAQGDKVLLALSGGQNSSVLFNLVLRGTSLDNHKKLRIKPICLYLSGAIPDYQKDLETAKSLLKLCSFHNIDIFIVSISQYFQKDLHIPKANSLDELHENEFEILKSKMAALNPTKFNDIRSKIMRSIFIQVAQSLQCALVFTAETTTTLARNLLCNIVLGRGSQIEHDIGFSDFRDENIKILRPMRDISIEELTYFSKLNNINTIEETDNLNSMQALIKSFVVNLQENYQATISTVCKTAEKLGTSEDLANKNNCILCQSKLSESGFKLTALEATNFSKSACLGMVSKDLTSNLTTYPDFKYCYGCSRSEHNFGN